MLSIPGVFIGTPSLGLVECLGIAKRVCKDYTD